MHSYIKNKVDSEYWTDKTASLSFKGKFTLGQLAFIPF